MPLHHGLMCQLAGVVNSPHPLFILTPVLLFLPDELTLHQTEVWLQLLYSNLTHMQDLVIDFIHEFWLERELIQLLGHHSQSRCCCEIAWLISLDDVWRQVQTIIRFHSHTVLDGPFSALLLQQLSLTVIRC